MTAAKRMLNFQRKKRKDALSPQLPQRIQLFYMREDISRTLPHKRDARKEGAGYGMQQTLREAFTLFNAKNRDTKIGYTRFTLLRPKIIRKISTTFFFSSESCLCLLTQCENEAAGTQQNHFPKQP